MRDLLYITLSVFFQKYGQGGGGKIHQPIMSCKTDGTCTCTCTCRASESLSRQLLPNDDNIYIYGGHRHGFFGEGGHSPL